MKAVNVVMAAALLALLAWMPASAVKYVAVVETGIDERSGVAADITSAEVALITAELRREAVNNLPRDRYSIMTSETVQSMGAVVLDECSAENCVILLGNNIGADFVVRGVISKFRTMLTLSIEIYETYNGTLVAFSDPIRSEKPAELLSITAEVSANMYRKFAGISETVMKKETGRQKETRKAEKKQAAETHTVTMSAEEMNNVTVSANKKHAVTMRYDKSTDEWYEDFSTGQRWGTWALNVLPGGLGSFLIMKDKKGGYVHLVSGGLFWGGVVVSQVYHAVKVKPTNDNVMIPVAIVAEVGFCGGGIFNIYRSATYHKPKPNSSAAAADFTPYDGLKFAIVPTESGAFKVLARYDYSF